MTRIIARKLNAEEHREINTLALNAFKRLKIKEPVEGEEIDPLQVLEAIAVYLTGQKTQDSEPQEAQQLSYEIGSLFGKLIEAKYHWQWYHLTDHRKNSLYAIAPENEKFCCPVHEYFYGIIGEGKNNNAMLFFNLLKGVEEKESKHPFEILS